MSARLPAHSWAVHAAGSAAASLPCCNATRRACSSCAPALLVQACPSSLPPAEQPRTRHGGSGAVPRPRLPPGTAQLSPPRRRRCAGRRRWRACLPACMHACLPACLHPCYHRRFCQLLFVGAHVWQVGGDSGSSPPLPSPPLPSPPLPSPPLPSPPSPWGSALQLTAHENPVDADRGLLLLARHSASTASLPATSVSFVLFPVRSQVTKEEYGRFGGAALGERLAEKLRSEGVSGWVCRRAWHGVV